MSEELKIGKTHVKQEVVYGVGAVVLLFVIVAMSRGGAKSGTTGGFNSAQGAYNAQIYSLAANHDVQIRQTQSEVDKEILKAGVNIVGIQTDGANKAAEIQSQRDIGLRQLDVMDADSQRQDLTKRYIANKQADVNMSQISAQREVGMAQVGATRDVGMAQASAARDVGMAQAGATRDVGLAQADAQKSVGLAQVGMQRDVGMAQVGVQQYDAETRRTLGAKQLDYGYDLGKTQLANNFTLTSDKNKYDYQLGNKKLDNDAKKNQMDYQSQMRGYDVQENGQTLNFFGGLISGVLGLFGL